MRTLAIDFGERRVGLAISDDEQKLALPLTTLVRQDDRSLIAEIAEIVHTEAVERLVLGRPLNVDGSAGPAAERVQSFAGKREHAVGLPVELIEETLTTIEAEARLRQAGVDPRKRPERIDAVAAQILLEEALNL